MEEAYIPDDRVSDYISQGSVSNPISVDDSDSSTPSPRPMEEGSVSNPISVSDSEDSASDLEKEEGGEKKPKNSSSNDDNGKGGGSNPSSGSSSGPSEGPSSAPTGSSEGAGSSVGNSTNRTKEVLGSLLGSLGGFLENVLDVLNNLYLWRSIMRNICIPFNLQSSSWIRRSLTFFICFSLLLRFLTCFISNIQIAINSFIFTFIFYIFLCYIELFSSFFYCADGSNKDSEEDSKEDEEDSKEDEEEEEEDWDESSSEEDELAHLEKKHLRISSEIKDIKHELAEVDKAEKLAKKLPESARNLNSHDKIFKKNYPSMSHGEIREYLNDELKRLQDDKKEYVSKISQAKESKSDTVEVDGPIGNKRNELSTEDTNPSKRRKSSNDDDSSGSSGPSAPSASSGITPDSNAPGAGDSESGRNNLSITIGKLSAILGSIIAGLSDFFDNIF